jgi:hypothetical protein
MSGSFLRALVGSSATEFTRGEGAGIVMESRRSTRCYSRRSVALQLKKIKMKAARARSNVPRPRYSDHHGQLVLQLRSFQEIASIVRSRQESRGLAKSSTGHPRKPAAKSVPVGLFLASPVQFIHRWADQARVFAEAPHSGEDRSSSHRPSFPNPGLLKTLFGWGYILNGATLSPSFTFQRRDRRDSACRHLGEIMK